MAITRIKNTAIRIANGLLVADASIGTETTKVRTEETDMVLTFLSDSIVDAARAKQITVGHARTEMKIAARCPDEWKTAKANASNAVAYSAYRILNFKAMAG